MTKEYADILVHEIASLRGYVFDAEHYFEYLGTWNSPDDDGELSYIYYYHEPIACDKHTLRALNSRNLKVQL